MRKMNWLNWLLVPAVMVVAGEARADTSNTVGEKLVGLIENVWNPLFLLIAVVAAVGGIWMMARGLMKLAEAASDRGGKGIAPGLVWILVGALLIALPDAAGMGMNTVFGAARGDGELSGAGLDYNDGVTGNYFTIMTGGTVAPGDVVNCLGGDDPAVCMARNIATNAVPMGIMVLFSLVFLAGLAGFAMTLVELAKGVDGRDQSKSHITRLVISIMLMNAPMAFSFMSQTVFGTSNSTLTLNGLNSGSSLLSYTSGSKIDIVVRYSALIGYSFTILAFFGAWAYIRGIFMVKGVAEAGRNAGSYGMAGVYMVAGILMANAKASTCVIMKTTGGATLAAGFC
ncbi:hypothetical protein HFO56_24630 [Rhizobium laguerreae]|uniref:hypothetical protein n=1 Tax=Rhizobium laguerreae TaxID=1076926 RepID=UPI001C8FEAE0|nr:hypothetical protein [Rhizobium laguerreae]MBY3155517.1 hypothetical protein [Rhizobium laguerreae]